MRATGKKTGREDACYGERAMGKKTASETRPTGERATGEEDGPGGRVLAKWACRRWLERLQGDYCMRFACLARLWFEIIVSRSTA